MFQAPTGNDFDFDFDFDIPMANPLDREEDASACTFLSTDFFYRLHNHLIDQFGNPLAGFEEDSDPGNFIYLIPHIAR